MFSKIELLAQKVIIINQSNFKSTEKPDIFKCITNMSDTTKGNYIATLEIKLGKHANAFNKGYLVIRDQSVQMNANAFKLNNYSIDENGNRTLRLDIYYFDDTKKIVRDAYQNKIYIFCDDRLNDKTYDLKVNNEKVVFQSGTYLQLETTPSQNIKLSKGGFTGMQAYLNYEKEKLPIFLSMRAFGIDQGMGVNSIGFNTGRFSTINTNLGYLLIQCLKKSE